MPIERTLSIVKPDGVGRNLIGEILNRFEKVGLRVVAARMMQLSQQEAEGLLRGTSRAALLQGSGEIHDLRTGHGPGARG